MRKPLVVYATVFCLAAACRSSALHQSTQPASSGSNVAADAGLIAAFKEKVDAYHKLRRDLAEHSPRLKETKNPAEISGAEKALAAKIRAARANAKQGDIFTPATEVMFRRLLRRPLTKGEDAAENRAIIKEDAPKPAQVPVAVNGEYPKEAPLSTVPPDVLKALPPLPENLQYRIVGKHMVLLCTQANLIVDYMLNAIP